jgi:hypothetical protein
MNLVENPQAPQSTEGESKVITLCGSTRFEAEFAEVNQRLTMEGCVVISLGMFSLPDLPDYDWTADSAVALRRAAEVCDEALLSRDGSTFDGWTELGAKRGQLLGRIERRRAGSAVKLDADGNSIPVRRHHPEQPRRTRPRRFAL